MKSKYLGLVVLSLSTALFVGCASVQKIKTGEPDSQAKADSAKAPQAEMKYVVKKGDSLWKISAKSSVYGDPFEWPLLFRANRDQITDPDIIDTNEELGVKKDFDENRGCRRERHAAIQASFTAAQKASVKILER
jgi:hypothetical protein